MSKGSPTPWRVPMRKPIRRMNESDYRVTGRQARAALAAAAERGLTGYSRINPGAFTRVEVHAEMSGWAADTPDDHYVEPIVAYRIRQEFGVEGQKPGRKSREWRRKTERWPTAGTP